MLMAHEDEYHKIEVAFKNREIVKTIDAYEQPMSIDMGDVSCINLIPQSTIDAANKAIDIEEERRNAKIQKESTERMVALYGKPSPLDPKLVQ